MPIDGVLGAELLASGAATELLAVLEETLEADDRSYMVLHHRAFTRLSNASRSLVFSVTHVLVLQQQASGGTWCPRTTPSAAS